MEERNNDFASLIPATFRRLAERGLAHAMNLGMHDFFPALAGKGNVVKHLQVPLLQM